MLQTPEILDNFTHIASGGAAMGVPLNPTLETIGRYGRRAEHDFSFSACHAVFTEAACMLRTNSSSQLTEHPDTNMLLPYDLAVDDTGQQFIDLFNSANGDEYFCMPDMQFTSGPVQDAHACGYAEISFANTAESMVVTAEQSVDRGLCDNDSGYVIFTGQDERPVLLRKLDGAPTALALEPLMINGILYPAGSIVRATTEEESMLEHEVMDSSQYPTDYQEVKAMPVSRIRNIGVIRLSLFAAREQERGTLATNPYANWLRKYKSIGSQAVLDTCHIPIIREEAYKALDILLDPAD